MMIVRSVFSQFRSNSRHLYSVGRIRVLETKLLGREVYRNLIQAAEVKDVLDILAETVLNPFVDRHRQSQDFEAILLDILSDLVDLVNGLSADPELTDLLVMPCDAENAKRIIASTWFEVDLEEVRYYRGLVPVELLTKSITDRYYTDLPPWLAAGLGRAEEVARERGRPRLIDHCLDQALMLHQIRTASPEKSRCLNDYFTRSIDLTNFLIFLRLKLLEADMDGFRDYFTPFGRIDFELFRRAAGESMESLDKAFAGTDYGKLITAGLEDFKEWGTLFRFESMIRNHLLERLLDGRRITFGVEPILAYYALRENEIRVIRAILVAKADGIKPETLLERLLIDHV